MSVTRTRLRLTRIMTICILLLFAIGATYWAGRAPLMEKSLFVVGIVLASFGATGRAWATAYISGHKLKTLVRTGPYSVSRNPLYFFSSILAIGFGFCTETLTIPLLIALAMTVLYYFQIRREEAKLAFTFGPEYDAYVATTPRFFPSFKNYSEPDEIRVSPRLLMKGLFGIAFLLLLIALLSLLDGLHETGLLPTLFHIY